MIIVEGMDGTGKSSLVKRLSEDLKLPVHARASDSVEGPVPAVFDWAHDDVSTWPTQPLAIYDRHPLVSELIYGPIIRGKVDDRFYQHDLLWDNFRKMSLIIFCDTAWERVLDNLQNDDAIQMSGVMDNSKRLHLMYRTYARVYDGMTEEWDYAFPGRYNRVLTMCEYHIKWWSDNDQ